MINIIKNIIQSAIFANVKSEISVRGISWKTQDSKKDDILFYKLNDSSEKSLNLLKERLLETSYAVLVTNLLHQEIQSIHNVIVIKEDMWLECQKMVLDFLYPLPSDVKIIGVTGTNGKTTTVDILSQLATMYNLPNITIGTLGVRKNNKVLESFGLTTPSFIDLRKYLNKYGKDVKTFFVEVSSHALVQQRYYGLSFEVSGWTSFSQDHLDYHQTLDAYFEAKGQIVSITKNHKVLISPNSKELLGRIDAFEVCDAITHKIDNSFFMAKHNIINLEVAIGILKFLGISPNMKCINDIQPPPGRFEIIKYRENFVVIDFAHTPDALENICLSIKKSFPGHELVTLFGCGGDRDRSKRPMMGKVAQVYSDRVILTSDNPRFERPEDIIDDIMKGITFEFVNVVIDRKEAIKFAINSLNKSILLIAGKGHESYIDVNGIKVPYSDEKVVKGIIYND